MSNKLNEQLALAISIANDAHLNQFDKAGKPYILHPLHLMTQLMFDTELAIIAVLHDVIEDSPYTLTNLEAYGFSKRVVDTVLTLTHYADETYEEYIDKMTDNYDAIRVKQADLTHNSDVTRLKGVSKKDLARVEKYRKAFLVLDEAKLKFLH